MHQSMWFPTPTIGREYQGELTKKCCPLVELLSQILFPTEGLADHFYNVTYPMGWEKLSKYFILLLFSKWSIPLGIPSLESHWLVLNTSVKCNFGELLIKYGWLQVILVFTDFCQLCTWVIPLASSNEYGEVYIFWVAVTSQIWLHKILGGSANFWPVPAVQGRFLSKHFPHSSH